MKAAMFPKLFEPGKIGNMKLKNRIIKAPQHTALAAPDGSVTEGLVRYYKEVALGGAGLVMVEYSWIDHDASRAAPCQVGVAGVDHVSGLSLLARTIHANGAKVALQMAHAGRQKRLRLPPIKAPSVIPWEELRPQELSFAEIQTLVGAFGDAARRVKMAGFDMIEIHAAHGYLIEEFLSPVTNRRTDWYGGSLENRMRFLLEVVQNARRQVGAEYPISVRLSGVDYESDNGTNKEPIIIAKTLEKLGVDVLNITDHRGIHVIAPMAMPLANIVWAAEAVKKVVGIPVIACGSITMPELAEQILEGGKADFIGLGRPLFADPYWAQKAKEGRPDDIRPCIRCNDGCLERSDMQGRAVLCTVNVALGAEEEFKICPAQFQKKVAVIGGGVAGMEAARVCALRGHDVTLYEKRKLGGVVIEGSVPEFKGDLRPLLRYFRTQMDKLDVEVVEQEATVDQILQGGFDAVIVATGGSPVVPDVPGINNAIVCGALEVLSGAKKVGTKVLMVGGGVIGTEVGLFLAEQGKEVVFVEMLDGFMNGLLHLEKVVYADRLARQKISVRTGRRLESVHNKGAVVVDRYGNREDITADSVVIAAGLISDRHLIEQLESETQLEVYEAGDCIKPRKLFDAIHEGHLAARLV